MSLSSEGMMSRKWQNSEPRRRCRRRFRAHLVRILGWAPEGKGYTGSYAATTGEMLRWAREGRAQRAASNLIDSVERKLP